MYEGHFYSYMNTIHIAIWQYIVDEAACIRRSFTEWQLRGWRSSSRQNSSGVVIINNDSVKGNINSVC